MIFPNFKEEKKLWKRGFDVVVGLDEAGRGPLAGPVVAAAVFARKNRRINLKINDSKKLSQKQREYFYEILTSHKDVQWGIGIVSEKVIDKINILESTKLAMQKALGNLYSNYDGRHSLSIVADFLLIDGNQALKFSKKFKMLGRAFSDTEYFGFDINAIQQKSVIKGDQKVFSISAASIIAKVTRDRIMQKMHKKYPQYGFEKHKGYGTAMHIKNLKNFGPCKIHRKSFYPVRELV